MSEVNGTNGVENRIADLVEVKPAAKPAGKRAKRQQETETRVAGSRLLGFILTNDSHEKNSGQRKAITTDPDTGAEVTLSVGKGVVTAKQWKEAARTKGLSVSYDDSDLEEVQVGADNSGLSFKRFGGDAEAFLTFVAEECIPPSHVETDGE